MSLHRFSRPVSTLPWRARRPGTRRQPHVLQGDRWTGGRLDALFDVPEDAVKQDWARAAISEQEESRLVVLAAAFLGSLDLVRTRARGWAVPPHTNDGVVLDG